MINYYYDQTDEFHPFTIAAEANADTIAPDNALRVEPTFKDNFHPCEKNGEWVLVEDNRGVKVYDTATKQESEVNYLGVIKKGFTSLKPNEFDKWDGEKWVEDVDAKLAHMIAENEQKKSELMKMASEQIELLSDAFELEIATDLDVSQLAEWKKYRVLLSRVDTNKAHDIDFPQQPVK